MIISPAHSWIRGSVQLMVHTHILVHHAIYVCKVRSCYDMTCIIWGENKHTACFLMSWYSDTQHKDDSYNYACFISYWWRKYTDCHNTLLAPKSGNCRFLFVGFDFHTIVRLYCKLYLCKLTKSYYSYP